MPCPNTMVRLLGVLANDERLIDWSGLERMTSAVPSDGKAKEAGLQMEGTAISVNAQVTLQAQQTLQSISSTNLLIANNPRSEQS